ncbi:hypothetical protein C9J21_07780 [Photobacterium phosphoreum]|uniref:hypothetical protein n=1 Tax=Photobacterium phosphoreum TaxID=659 RepID=UPI000D157781|nr:hypothetical protein [Photobacterium phosphoreum]PSU73031.1 hypothetical protein C9J22_03575 [Photobacterium phosphoreum]PSW33482.1 hypothetical protein C9J21_07780 [Photobacterium phosphoreum]
MKAWLLKVNDRQRRIVAAVIVILLVAVSLVTTGLTSALCDLSAFVILVGALWLKMKGQQLKNISHEELKPSVKMEIEP